MDRAQHSEPNPPGVNVGDVGAWELANPDLQSALQVMESTVVGPFALVDLDGRFLFGNTAFQSLLGYSPRELRGASVHKITLESARPVQAATLREQVVALGQTKLYNTEFVCKNGRVLAVQVRAVAFRSENRASAIWLIVRDLPHAKKPLDATKGGEALLQAIVESSRDAIGVFDEGIHAYVNPAYVAMFGYSNPEDLVGRPVFELADPCEHARLERYLAARQIGNAPSCYELQALRRDGGTFVVEANMSSFDYDGTRYTLALLRDVTERKKAEAALAKSEEKFSKAFDTIPEAALIMNLADGTVIEANQRFYEFTGYRPSEVIGKTRYELRLWGHVGNMRRFLKMLETNRKVRGLQAKFRLKSGEVRDGEISSNLIEIDGVLHSLNFIADVTDRKRAEEAIKRAHDELETRVDERTAQLKLANHELESFSYSVSHDLRAPLRSMDGFSRILMEDYGHLIDEEGQNYLRRISNAAERMGRLVDDLLKLARINKTEMKVQQVDLGAISRDVVRKLRETDPGRSVEVKVASGLQTNGDAELLYSVMDNLIGNSWKYTSRLDKARIEIGKCRSEGKNAFFVRDDGVGFDMTFAARLFGPFQRLHRESEFPGNGIGLATVQRIVSRHRGEIWAQAEVDKGATFFFTLDAKA